jgi:hypothetical protein
VFDEINGSQVEQVDIDELDDAEAPCVALKNMSIRDVYPQESRSTIIHSSITPTQDGY